MICFIKFQLLSKPFWKQSEERTRDSSTRSPQATLRPGGSSPCVLPNANFENTQQIIYKGHYDDRRYTRLTDHDVWTQLNHQSFGSLIKVRFFISFDIIFLLITDRQKDRRSSTESEHSFHAKYQVILHRLVQRRCTLEMYHRQKNNNFRKYYYWV